MSKVSLSFHEPPSFTRNYLVQHCIAFEWLILKLHSGFVPSLPWLLCHFLYCTNCQVPRWILIKQNRSKFILITDKADLTPLPYWKNALLSVRKCSKSLVDLTSTELIELDLLCHFSVSSPVPKKKKKVMQCVFFFSLLAVETETDRCRWYIGISLHEHVTSSSSNNAASYDMSTRHLDCRRNKVL